MLYTEACLLQTLMKSLQKGVQAKIQQKKMCAAFMILKGHIELVIAAEGGHNEKQTMFLFFETK